MFCPKCGKESEDTWVFCSFCGTKLPNQKNVSSRNITDLYPEFKDIGVTKKTPKSIGRRSMLCTVTEKIDELLFSPLTPSTHKPSNVSPKSKEIRSAEKTTSSGGRRSMLGTLTEKMEKLWSKYFKESSSSIFTPSKSNNEIKIVDKKEVKVTDLGEMYSLLILELTKRMFDDTILMKDLGIKKTNDSVKELHILNYYLIVRSIVDSLIDDNLKKSLISRVFDKYIGLVIDYHTEVKKMDDQSMFQEIMKFENLIKDRLHGYDEVYHKLMVRDVSSNLEGGRIFIETLKNILPPKNTENVFDVLPFVFFFFNSLDITSRMMNIHSYRIRDVSLQEEYQSYFDERGVKCKVSVEKDGRLKFKFSE